MFKNFEKISEKMGGWEKFCGNPGEFSRICIKILKKFYKNENLFKNLKKNLRIKEILEEFFRNCGETFED